MVNNNYYRKVLNNFTFDNEDKARDKINKFINDGVDKLHLLLDFDRTMTVGTNYQAGATTTWAILANHLPHSALNRYVDLYNVYRPLEISGKMSVNDAVVWWEGCLKLFAEHRINLKEIEKIFLTKISIRPETKELFDLCQKLGVPTIILSSGIKDIIDLWVEKFEIKPSLVLSTKLDINSNDEIVGWEKNTLIHMLNKKEMGHNEISIIRKGRPNIILIGDDMGDANMVDGEENVLRIRIYDPREDEKTNRVAYLSKTFEKFDLIIESGDFTPVLEMLKDFTSL